MQSVRRQFGTAALTLGAILLALLFLSVAAAGCDGWKNLLADPIRTGAAIALTVLAAATPLCGCNLSVGLRKEDGNDWVLAFLLICGLLLGWVSAVTDRRNLWTIGGEAVRCAGVTLLVLGAALRILSIRALGERFTVWVAIQDGHELVTDGLYRHVRHPSYAGALLMVVGWAMVFRSGPGLLIAAAMGAALIARIHAEERLLIRQFPLAYPDYAKRSWRLVPLVY